MIRISDIKDSEIEFDNGDVISFGHYQDCCEWNYADFVQLDDLAKNYAFELPLKFESVDGAGFRFGDSRNMFFVPCYSEQNGYYSSDIEITYNNETVLRLECEIRY